MRLIDADALIVMEYGGIKFVPKEFIDDAPTIEERKTWRWSGLWSEPDNEEDAMYGEKLNEGDTIYLLGVEGTVRKECGAWGWGSYHYVPWEELKSRIPHNNEPTFCYCDNFVSFWELKWNFDDGHDWDGVPFVSHNADTKMEVEHE